MVYNKKEKVFTQRDFLASESLGLAWVFRVLIFMIIYFSVVLVSSVYFYFINDVEIGLFEYIMKSFGLYLNLDGLLKRYGVYLFIFLLGIVGLFFFKKRVAYWHVKTPVLVQPILLNWNSEVLIVRSVNEELKSTFYWKDIKIAKKTDVGVNLYLNPVYPIRIPFDWFDDDGNKQNFLQLVKIATGKDFK